jgi:threonine/homoserine/homoserine lactone efflux protein
MNHTGRPSPPPYVWLTLAVALFVFVRGVQDLATNAVTGSTWFRLAAAAYLSWTGISEWRKFLRRSRPDAASRPDSTISEER